MDSILSMISGINFPNRIASTRNNAISVEDAIPLASLSLSMKKRTTTTIMDLPPELQTKILLYLPVESIREARLVCSTWCDLIDSSREFSLIVNDRKYDYLNSKFPPWKITSCLIKYFQLYESINFLPYPAALQKLSIWGYISKTNFHMLMRHACNIEELDLSCDFFSSTKDFWTVNGNHQSVKLDHLRKLTIFSNFNIIHHRDNLFGLFKQSMPNLTKLKITMDDPSFNKHALIVSPEEVSIAIKLVKFISGQKNLKFLQLSISPVVFCDEEWLLETLGRLREYPNCTTGLSQISLQICRLQVSPLYTWLLRPLLTSQSCLKDFRIQSPFMEGVPILYQHLENSVRCSVEHLAAIHLEWISKFPPHPMTVVNFGLFSQAKNLKRLILKRWWGFGTRPNTNGMAKISHLDQLPASLQQLNIEGFLCSTDEMKAIAESAAIMLTDIRLIQVGLFGDGVGISGKVVKALCAKDSLNTMSLGPLKSQVTDREDPEFQELRERFKDDHFRNGKLVSVNFVEYRRKQELKRKKEAQAEERRRILFGCFIK